MNQLNYSEISLELCRESASSIRSEVFQSRQACTMEAMKILDVKQAYESILC